MSRNPIFYKRLIIRQVARLMTVLQAWQPSQDMLKRDGSPDPVILYLELQLPAACKFIYLRTVEYIHLLSIL